MRTFMSRLQNRRQFGCHDRLAWEAVREARAILAETEPELPSVTWFEPGVKLTAVTTAHRAFSQMRAGNTAAALAEALAAFVGEGE